MARKLIVAGSILATVIVMLTIWLRDPVGIAVQWAAIRATGPLVEDCGYAQTVEALASTNQCVEQALATNRPFRVVSQFYGMDSLYTTAILRDRKGRLFTAGVDSEGGEQVTLLRPRLLVPLPLYPCNKVQQLPFNPKYYYCQDIVRTPVN